MFFSKNVLVGLFALLIATTSANAEEAMKTNYVLNFNSNDALCFVKINDMLVLLNDDASIGSFSMGKTVSSFLQNGKNTISISMSNDSSENDSRVTDSMWCSVTIKRVDELKPAIGAKLIVTDEKIKNDTTFYPSPIIFFGDSPRADNGEEDMIEVTKNFDVQDLPDWSWTKGRPITNADTAQVKAFYDSLQNAFKQQDLEKIYQMTEGMWATLAQEQGSTREAMINSMNFKKFFERGYKAVDIDWNDLKLNSYMGGRIFRYEIGYGRLSPLELKDGKDGYFSLTPYLSSIDGKVTVFK